MPVLEVTVNSVEVSKRRLAKNGREIIKDEPGFPSWIVILPRVVRRSHKVVRDDTSLAFPVASFPAPFRVLAEAVRIFLC